MSKLKSPHRLSYLLRLWRTEGVGDFEWRASLESLETGERIGFANLEQLFVYCLDLTESNVGPPPGTGKDVTRIRD